MTALGPPYPAPDNLTVLLSLLVLVGLAAALWWAVRRAASRLSRDPDRPTMIDTIDRSRRRVRPAAKP
jgi:hypothetical protein